MKRPQPSSKKPEPDLCVLSIGYFNVLLPADKGLKVATLLRGALEVRHCSEHRMADWEIEGTLRVNYETAEPGRIRQKLADREASTAPLALGHEPLKLTHTGGAR